MTFVEQLNRSRPGGCLYYTHNLYAYDIFNLLQWHLQLSEMGPGRYMNYKFEFPESVAACEVVRLTPLYLFFITGCLAWQRVSTGWAGWTRQAGRQAGGGGVGVGVVDFLVWANRLQCLSRQRLGCGHFSLSGGKGAKCLSIITGSVLSQDTPPDPSPPNPSHSTPAWVQWGYNMGRERCWHFLKLP